MGRHPVLLACPVTRSSGVSPPSARMSATSKVGDLVGVGCLVDSCKHCHECAEGFENYCDNMVLTYNSPTTDEPGWTMGATRIDCRSPTLCASREPSRDTTRRGCAPLCAGITTYSPLSRRADGDLAVPVGMGVAGHFPRVRRRLRQEGRGDDRRAARNSMCCRRGLGRAGFPDAGLRVPEFSMAVTASATSGIASTRPRRCSAARRRSAGTRTACSPGSLRPTSISSAS